MARKIVAMANPLVIGREIACHRLSVRDLSGGTELESGDFVQVAC